MHGKAWKILIGAILAVAMVAVMPGCGKAGTTATKPGEPEYAGAIAESILQAFNSGDYAAYNKNFDEAMQKAMPEAAFEGARKQVRDSYGDYVSKEFSSLQENVQNIYTAVNYTAKFSKKSDVTVRVVFLETDDKVLVSGLWFQ